MISSGDLEKYQKLYEKVHEKPFSFKEPERYLQMHRGYTKVFLHRLREAHAVHRISRGKYILTDPARWLQINTVQKKYPQLNAFFERIGPAVNDIDLLVLHGSLARGEPSPNSDIDLLVVTPHPERVKIVQKPYSVEVTTPKEFYKELQKDPLFLYAALHEGTLLLGDSLADFVKGLGIDREKLREKLIESIIMIRKWQEVLKPPSTQDAEWSAIYSATLRLRTAFIVKSLLRGESWTYTLLEKEFLQNYDDRTRFRRYYAIYKKKRDKQKNTQKTHRNAVKKYLRAVEDYIIDVWEEHYAEA